MTRYQKQKAKAASERGRRKANIRWERDHARRAALARMDPIDSKPVRRIIGIRGDRVIEICIFPNDSIRSIRAKLKNIGFVPAKRKSC